MITKRFEFIGAGERRIGAVNTDGLGHPVGHAIASGDNGQAAQQCALAGIHQNRVIDTAPTVVGTCTVHGAGVVVKHDAEVLCARRCDGRRRAAAQDHVIVAFCDRRTGQARHAKRVVAVVVVAVGDDAGRARHRVGRHRHARSDADGAEIALIALGADMAPKGDGACAIDGQCAYGIGRADGASEGGGPAAVAQGQRIAGGAVTVDRGVERDGAVGVGQCDARTVLDHHRAAIGLRADSRHVGTQGGGTGAGAERRQRVAGPDSGIEHQIAPAGAAQGISGRRCAIDRRAEGDGAAAAVAGVRRQRDSASVGGRRAAGIEQGAATGNARAVQGESAGAGQGLAVQVQRSAVAHANGPSAGRGGRAQFKGACADGGAAAVGVGAREGDGACARLGQCPGATDHAGDRHIAVAREGNGACIGYGNAQRTHAGGVVINDRAGVHRHGRHTARIGRGGRKAGHCAGAADQPVGSDGPQTIGCAVKG